MKYNILDNGLIIAEEIKENKKEEVKNTNGLKCVICGKQSCDEKAFFWRTSDGFEVDWPTCGHGKFIRCKGCRDSNCPVCGCGEFYT